MSFGLSERLVSKYEQRVRGISTWYLPLSYVGLYTKCTDIYAHKILISSWDMTHDPSFCLSVSFSLFVSFIHNGKQRDNNIQIPPKEFAWKGKNGVGKWKWFWCLDLVSLWISTFHNHLHWFFLNHSIYGIWLWLPTQNNRTFLHFILSQLRQNKRQKVRYKNSHRQDEIYVWKKPADKNKDCKLFPPAF